MRLRKRKRKKKGAEERKEDGRGETRGEKGIKGKRIRRIKRFHL